MTASCPGSIEDLGAPMPNQMAVGEEVMLPSPNLRARGHKLVVLNGLCALPIVLCPPHNPEGRCRQDVLLKTARGFERLIWPKLRCQTYPDSLFPHAKSMILLPFTHYLRMPNDPEAADH